jgi:hypothetical protein
MYLFWPWQAKLTYNVLLLHRSKMDRLPGECLDVLKQIVVQDLAI